MKIFKNSYLWISIFFVALGVFNMEAKEKIIKVFDFKQSKFINSKVVVKTDEEWKSQLDKLSYDVLRKQGTERAFSGKYNDNKKHGVYTCNGCGLDLFLSEDKFDSGTGWPSFTKPIAMENVKLKIDKSFFTVRTEVICARCGGHLGHVFNDGPEPTGKRYCMNSVSLDFYEVNNK